MKRLREEIESYKVRLVRYEVIERQRDITNLKSYQLLKDNVKSLTCYDTLEEARRLEANMRDFMSKSGLESQERRRAIEQLSRTTIELLFPFTHKYLIWAAANNSGPFNAENMEMPGLGFDERDEWNGVLKDVRASEEEYRSVYDSKPFLAAAAGNLHRLVTQYITCQRQIQEQMRLVDEHIYHVLVPKVNPVTLNVFISWIEKVRSVQASRWIEAEQT